MLKQIEGSHAVAEAVALCRPEVICAYPISPQTHIVEGVGEMVKSGELANCEFINVESEFAAMSVATAVRPTCRIGWWIVLSCGVVVAASRWSSNPMTSRSSGTVSPRLRAASIAPLAMRSEAQKTASRSGRRSNNLSKACRPDSEL